MSQRGEIFQTAPVITPKTSWFDMSSDNLLSCNAGKLIPHNIIECMPGDHIKGKTHVFGRVAPMLAPTFGKVDVMTYDFFVRSRDIWKNFDEFITNQDQDDPQPNNQGAFVAPASPKFSFSELINQQWLSRETEQTFFVETSYHDLRVLNNGDNVLGNPFVSPVLHIFWTNDGVNPEVSSELFLPFINGKYEADGLGMDYPYVETAHNLYILLNPSFNDAEAIIDSYHNQQSYVKSDFEDYIKLFKCYYSSGGLFDYYGADFTGWFSLQSTALLSDIRNMLIHKMGGSWSIEQLRHFIDVQLRPLLLSSVGERQVVAVCYSYGNDIDHQFSRYQGYVGYGEPSLPLLYAQEYRNYSLLPFYAYQFIYNEYFRDQNYIPKVYYNSALNGVVSFQTNPLLLLNLFELRNKAYMHDPYTSALPAPQRGQAVRYLSDAKFSVGDAKQIPAGTLMYGFSTTRGVDSEGQIYSTGSPQELSGGQIGREITVDLSAATIENFRWANAMQRYLEAVNRTGGRYFEYILGIYGKEVLDSKINRPIYINGNRTPLQISEVLQTGSTDLETQQPLGDMAGRGIVIGSDDSVDYECPDWGFYVQLSVVVPRTSYMSGMNPMFERETYLDYPIPQFAQLGEEYVRVSELWNDGTQEMFEKPFGYQSRYYQWKYRRDEVHGDFKTSLDFWHWSRKFEDEPVNGKEFLEINPDYRQFAVTDKSFQHYYLYFDHRIEMKRPLPIFGIPTL